MTPDEDWEHLAGAVAVFLERTTGLPGLWDAPAWRLARELERITPPESPRYYDPPCGRWIVFPDNLGSAPCACNGKTHPLKAESGRTSP